MTQTKENFNTTKITDAARIADYTGMCTPRHVPMTDKIHSLIILEEERGGGGNVKLSAKKGIARALEEAAHGQHKLVLKPLPCSNFFVAKNSTSATNHQ